MDRSPTLTSARLRRLYEELGEVGVEHLGDGPLGDVVLDEVDYALRPRVHERRTPAYGSIIDPISDADHWGPRARLIVSRRPIGDIGLRSARAFADGRSSWIVRHLDPPHEWAVFDRPAGSERDLVVLSEALGATIVQRHATGAVRAVGTFGVLRHEGVRWHHEPPLAAWVDSISACPVHGSRQVLDTLLRFAVHDLGSRGIGATLVYRPDPAPSSAIQIRLPAPPPLEVGNPADLAPLRHALTQIDGAAVFDTDGVLRELGVRLVPSPRSESQVEGLGGMRHTSGRRYSVDDPVATVIVVSEDGPVTVLRNGELLGVSPSPPALGQ